MAKTLWRRSRTIAPAKPKTIEENLSTQKTEEASNVAAITKVEPSLNCSNHSKKQVVEEEAPVKDENEEAEAEVEAPKSEDGIIQKLYTKLCVQEELDDATAASSIDEIDEGSVEEDHDAGYKPKALKCEQMVIENVNGGLAFLSFTRFPVVDEATHLLIKVMVSVTFIQSCMRCGNASLTHLCHHSR